MVMINFLKEDTGKLKNQCHILAEDQTESFKEKICILKESKCWIYIYIFIYTFTHSGEKSWRVVESVKRFQIETILVDE
jgi:hypothetical protein